MLKRDQDGVTRYGYDKSNRLITVEPVPAYIPGEEAFIYDKNGNRRFDKGAKDYQYDAANRLQGNTVYAYTHDANGNLTGRTHKAGGTAVTYAYNLEQQLAEVVTPGHKLQYKYDPLGRRIERSVDGSPTHYVYDNEDIIAMLDGEGKVLQTFTHGPGIDEPLILTKADGANYYYHADGLGSIVALTDAKANVIESYSYKAYGQPKLKNAKGEELTASAVGNPYLFTARGLDAEAGLYYYRARYYDWLRGSFTQEDVLGFDGGDSNLYAYASANPMMYLDQFGLFSIDIADSGGRNGKTYGGMMMVTSDDGRIVFVNVSTWPNPKNMAPGIKAGDYESVYSKTGHRGKTNGIRLKDGGDIPTLGPNPMRNGDSLADGINIHCGDTGKNRGSKNCITINPNQCDKVWSILREGEKGTVSVNRSGISQFVIWLRSLLQ